MMPRKKRIATIVIVISFVIILLCAVLIYLLTATDVFKSDKELFGKYLFKTSENIENFFENYEQEELTKYTSQMKAKINYTADMNTTAEDNQNNLNNIILNVDSQVDKESNYDYKEIYIQNSDEKLAKLEYLKNNDIYAVRVDGIKQFVAIKNQNLKDFSQKMGLSEDQINLIPNELDEKKIDFEKIKFTEDEKKQIANRYLKILNENVSKEKFSKQSNALITINGNDMNTNAYSLTLTKEQYNNLKIKILEQLKDDETILNKLELLKNETENIYKNANSDYKQNYINSIETTIKEIQDTNIGQEEVKISVYVNNKKTVRVIIDDKTTKTTMDFVDKDNKNKVMELNITKYDTVENSVIATIKRENQDNNEKISISIESIKAEEVHKLEMTLGNTKKSNNIIKDFSISYNNGTNQLVFNVEDNIEKKENLENKIELTKNNNIILNELEQNKASIIISKVLEKVLNQINSIQNKVNEEDINSILSMFSTGESISLGDGTITENEKNRFNAQFEFYEGDEVQLEDIQALLTALKDNTSKVEIISNDKDDIKIKISVKSQKNDEKGIEQVKQLLESKDNKDKKYKVKVGYGENGLINAIAIVYVKE